MGMVAGDLDGDLLDDLVIAADDGGVGVVSIFLGGQLADVPEGAKIGVLEASSWFVSGNTNSAFRQRLRAVGDITGDGQIDLVISDAQNVDGGEAQPGEVPSISNAGKVYVIGNPF